MKRRDFIKASASLVSLSAIPSFNALAASTRQTLVTTSPIANLPLNQTCHWLSSDYWGNRLQDWRLKDGAIECLQGDKSFEVRTAAILTRQLNELNQPARIQAIINNITPDKSGFGGFLLGVGQGQLDYRGAALAQRAAGVKGGILAVINEQGQLSFRDFSNQSKPLDYELLSRANSTKIKHVNTKDILLDCHIDPIGEKLFDVRLIATDIQSQKEVGFAVLNNVSADILQGGLSLVSSPNKNQAGARWRFKHIATGGDKISINQTQGLGPIMGCLHSVNQQTLKLTAQFMPVDLRVYQSATLAIKRPNEDKWLSVQSRPIEDGYIALFRLDNWSSDKTFDYRIVCDGVSTEVLYQGQILADPGQTKTLNIALYSCIIPTAKSLDDLEYKRFIPEEKVLPRYGKENILFPHNTLVEHCDSHAPDLYVFCGDQYYETYPTRYGRDSKEAKIDTLYRWYLWYWTFRESVRNKPAIILADDHDVLQGNLWGAAGNHSEKPKEEDGGFKWNKDLIRMVYRIQHGHNPDPFDATPIKYNIPVTYGAFIYGGVNFAMIEDRKFKTPPDYKTAPQETTGELLGPRQEQFLAHWKNTYKNLPKICLTASIWGSPQTDSNFKPLLDYDANGYPPDGRTRAVKLVSEANALVLAGDQHLGMVAQQGINDFDDGSVFFAGPAAAAFWQRWFEGDNRLDNQFRGDSNSGNFIDTFGNKMRVLAVANPKISHKTFDQGNKSWGKFLADNRIKSEGYGMIKVEHDKQHYTLECWPWQANPLIDKQFSGWPIKVSFLGKPMS